MNADLRIFGGPRRYLQGPNALASLAAETLLFGRRPILLTDRVVCDALESSLRPTFPNLEVVLFSGQCTRNEIVRVAEVGTSAACDVVIGAGGGKALDVAKAVASELGHEVVIVPTVASNDAATSRCNLRRVRCDCRGSNHGSEPMCRNRRYGIDSGRAEALFCCWYR